MDVNHFIHLHRDPPSSSALRQESTHNNSQLTARHGNEGPLGKRQAPSAKLAKAKRAWTGVGKSKLRGKLGNITGACFVLRDDPLAMAEVDGGYNGWSRCTCVSKVSEEGGGWAGKRRAWTTGIEWWTHGWQCGTTSTNCLCGWGPLLMWLLRKEGLCSWLRGLVGSGCQALSSNLSWREFRALTYCISFICGKHVILPLS